MLNCQTHYDMQRQKVIEKELSCVFVRINPDEENLTFLKP